MLAPPPHCGYAAGVRRLPRLPALALSALLVGSSCGPSVQSIYEGNVRFEHCYRLDLDTRTAPTHREACWREWTRDYSYGQTRDRIDYARRRIRVLASGDSTRPSLNFDSEGGSAQRSFFIVAPAPTSAHAPPPAVAVPYRPEEAPTGSKADGGAVASRSTPGQQCAVGCADAWQKCQASCGDASADPRCARCDADYGTCMRRCFK
jgi:hypothetical protein